MPSLAQQKCLNHGDREAVARCPQCRSHFCRECVSEHRGRILCAPCLAQAARTEQRPAAWKRAWAPLGAVAGLALAWVFFLCLGKVLLLIPASYHDGAWVHQAGNGPVPESPDPSGAGSGSKDGK
ncbi:MAG TPA: rhomboid family protein [Fibrobacteria bacterium]|nr:rhomboid family protein [Fibrobacteria bacterium]